jgi:putative spermidine/putrescine transport system ATP-binding protein
MWNTRWAATAPGVRTNSAGGTLVVGTGVLGRSGGDTSGLAGDDSAGHEAGRPDIRLVGLTKRFGDLAAVDDVHLAIGRGEFFTMLGPSGSGKTTTLRLIAGFERPDAGRVELGGQDAAGRPPFERDVNTVFQDYAVFPHMTILENVAYGLRVRKVAKAQRWVRAQEALETVRLLEVADRKPAQLSGGQRQRVALARAIVNRPRVLLLDEPLGALVEMQTELKRIQGEVGITFVYVTHDQDEALSMSDRLAVFNHGRIEQVGAPVEVYERPASTFVAGFIGVSNVLERDGRRFTIRPEKIRILSTDESGDGLRVEAGTVRDTSFNGSATSYRVVLRQGGELTVVRQNLETSHDEARKLHGHSVRLGWREQHAVAISATKEQQQ